MPKDGEIKSGIGASSKRREDVRFLTGNGNYTDDINIRGQAYVFFLRSDVAHGTLNSVDICRSCDAGCCQDFHGC